MNSILYFFGSGDAFFVGIGFILVGLAISVCFSRRLLVMTGFLVAEAGLLFVVLSAAPLPYWLYIVSCEAVCFAVEVPFRFVPVLPVSGHPAFAIIGDSVTAGFGEPDKNTMMRRGTWPSLLVQQHDIEVTDLSQMGATAASALKQADKLPEKSDLVLLEIGGNDLLGSTSASKFESDLEALMKRVCASGRTLMMFELPLPPFRNEYGQVQRKLAARYHVLLIPKRVFIAVLTTPGATLDGIHLTPAGHEQMAEVIWSVIKPAYGG
jgi:acyl-CoA thioesterase I